MGVISAASRVILRSGVHHALRELKFVDVYPGFSPAGPSANPVTLDEAYEAQAAPVIDRQLERGGVRLAAILNDAFGGRRSSRQPFAGR